jgi:hypothetical protein
VLVNSNGIDIFVAFVADWVSVGAAAGADVSAVSEGDSTTTDGATAGGIAGSGAQAARRKIPR